MSNSYDAVVEAVRDLPGVGSGRMFGSEGLKVGGKVFAMAVKGALVVKVPEARATEIVKAGHGEFFDPGHGRRMKQWVSVRAASDIEWVALAREAYEYLR